jgi:uncharacterized membrane protein YphA (DoxX/SURF4 family)
MKRTDGRMTIDQLLGGVAIAYFFHRSSIAASSHGVIGPFHRITHIVLVFALTCAATVFWEFAEFTSDRYHGTHAQIDLEDTMGDMLLGICGGVVLIIGTVMFPPRPES